MTLDNLYRKSTDLSRRLGQSFWFMNMSVWTVYWMINVIMMREHGITWHSMRIFYSLAAMTGVIRKVYHKIDYQNKAMPKMVLIIFGVSMLGSFAFYCLNYGYVVLVEDWDFIPVAYLKHNYTSIYYTGSVLVTWSIAYFVWKVRQSLKNETTHKERNILLAQRAELQLLRYQLNPHFLFNSLNSIRALTLNDVAGAREMISELSEFLKYSVMTKNDLEVPLKQEMEALHHYLRIEKIRFKSKLIIETHVDPIVEDYPIPVLLLHPLVENAIKYGMKTAELPLKIKISAWLQENNFHLEVSNNGRWIDASEKKSLDIEGTSSGLRNVIDRLANAYPDGHHLEIIKKTNQVSVRIRIENEGLSHE